MTVNTRSVLLMLFFTVIAAGVMQNCSTGKDKLDIFLNLERKNLSRSSMLVLNFKEPRHAEGLGSYIAERFHLYILKSKKVKVCSLHTASQWCRLGDTEEEQLARALEEARDRQYDFLLLGELKEVFDGGLTTSRVRLKTRIIEVKTRTTIMLAEHTQTDKSKETTFPMNADISKKAASPKVILDSMARALVRKLPKPPVKK